MTAIAIIITITLTLTGALVGFLALVKTLGSIPILQIDCQQVKLRE